MCVATLHEHRSGRRVVNVVLTPGAGAYERHEATWAKAFHGVAVAVLLHAVQFLPVQRPHRYHHPAAVDQLVQEGTGQARRRCGNHYGFKRSFFRAAQYVSRRTHRHIVTSHRIQPLTRGVSQVRQPLHGNHLPRQQGQYTCLIA